MGAVSGGQPERGSGGGVPVASQQPTSSLSAANQRPNSQQPASRVPAVDQQTARQPATCQPTTSPPSARRRPGSIRRVPSRPSSSERTRRMPRQAAARQPCSRKHKRRRSAQPTSWYPGGGPEDLESEGHPFSSWSSGTPAEQHLPTRGEVSAAQAKAWMPSWGMWTAVVSRALRASMPLLCFLLCLLLASSAGAVPAPGAPVALAHHSLQSWQPPLYQTSQPQPQLVAAITMTLPNPSFHEEARRRYVRDPDSHWTLGMHPEASADHVQHLKEVLAQHQHVAAYSITDLPGYTGAVPPFRLELDETPVPTRP